MILTAFPVGFFAGLFGIGGGLITVPFLFFIFETLNIDRSYIMHLAVGTSFSIIIPTALASVLTHKKNKKGTVISPPPIPNRPAKKPTGKAVRIIKIIKKEYSLDKIELINLTCKSYLRS